MLHRVAVLGGGPGGLYAARLLKLARPGTEVVVHEQGVPDETFGFGVGLAARTQRRLEEADPDTLRDILACSYSARHADARRRPGGRDERVEPGRRRARRAPGRAPAARRGRRGEARVRGAACRRRARRRPGDRRGRGGERDALGGSGGVRRRGRARDGLVPVGRHGRRAGPCAVRAGAHGARRVRHARLPLRAGPQHVPRRDRRGDVARAGFEATTAATPFDASDDDRARLPLRRVRAAPGRAPADREPDALAAVPDGALRRAGTTGARCCSGTRRTRRTTPSARGRSSRWRTRSRWSRRWTARTPGPTSTRR